MTAFIERFATRTWQEHSVSLPVCIASIAAFSPLAIELRNGRLDQFDRPIQQWVKNARGPLDGLMFAFTTIGGFWPMTVLTFGVLAWLIHGRRMRAVRYLVVSAGGSLLLNVLLKAGFHRTRPKSPWPYVLPTPSSFAFPSGHTMGSAGVVASLAVLLWLSTKRRSIRLAGAALAVTVALGVGISRIYFGAHYPSDVLGGWLIAIAWVSFVTGWMHRTL